MFRAFGSLLALAFALATGHSAETGAFVSPCPDVFTYEPPGTEPGKWYGVVNLTADTTLYALWLNIVLESKADILGNWIGEVTTEDNLDFKIENTKLKIVPNQPLSIRFFIQYNSQSDPPKLQAIRFNGKEICNVNKSKTTEYSKASELIENYRAAGNTDKIKSTTTRPTITTSRNSWQTTTKSQYWAQTKAENSFKGETGHKEQTTSNPYWVQTKTDNTQTKSDRQQTTSKPFWQQSKIENTTSKTQYWTQTTEATTQSTLRPQTWSYGKVDNDQSTNQKKVSNTQRTTTQDRNTRPDDKVNKKSDVNNKNRQDNLYKQQTTEATTQLWSVYKITTKQPTKSDEKFKSENKLTTTIKPSSIWEQVKADNQQDTKTRNKQDIKSTGPLQYWADTTEDNTKTEVDSSSLNNQQVRPNLDYQNRPYDRLQARPVEVTDTPIYVRPEDKIVESIISSIHADTQKSSQRRTQNDQLEEDAALEIIPIKIQGLGSIPKDNQKWADVSLSNWAGNKRHDWTQEDQPKKRVIFESAGDSPSYHNDGNEDTRTSYNGYEETSEYTTKRSPPKILQVDEFSIDNNKKEDDIDGFVGGLPTIYIPNHPPLRTEPTCGRVLKKPSSRLQKGSTTEEGQWPWQIALYQQQTTVDFKYICGGTLVTSRHIITAAHCVTRKGSRRVVNKNTLTVYLGKYNLRTSVEGVQVKFVDKITVHPEYNATTFSRDVAILRLRESVAFSDYVQPACLWPENEIELKTIVGKKGSVVGWGFEVTGVAREELSLLEMPVVDQDTCVRSYIDFYRKFTSDYTYCAGYKDGTSVCNGDSGGGMVFKKGNNWFLRGLASLSVARQGEYRCDPNHYVIFTDLAKMLPWIEENIEDY